MNIERIEKIKELLKKMKSCTDLDGEIDHPRADEYLYIIGDSGDIDWLIDTVEDQQKEIARLKDDVDLYRRKLVQELKRHDNLRKDFFELSAYCVDKDKNIDYLLKENTRLRVTEQAYEALLKSV